MFGKRLTKENLNAIKKSIRRCPRCGDLGILREVNKCKISWSETEKTFTVSFAISAVCHSGPRICPQKWSQIVRMKDIPLAIAQESSCSCGSVLNLQDHVLKKNGDLVEFEGEYVCEKCQQSRNSLIKKIGKKLASLWKDTKKIEVGPKGITYEKESK